MVWGWRGRGWEVSPHATGARSQREGMQRWNTDTVGAQPLQSFILGSNKGQMESTEPPSRAQQHPNPSSLHATRRDVREHLQRHEQPSSLQQHQYSRPTGDAASLAAEPGTELHHAAP